MTCMAHSAPTVGDRTFPVPAARLWNSLPSHVTAVPSLSPSSAVVLNHISSHTLFFWVGSDSDTNTSILSLSFRPMGNGFLENYSLSVQRETAQFTDCSAILSESFESRDRDGDCYRLVSTSLIRFISRLDCVVCPCRRSLSLLSSDATGWVARVSLDLGGWGGGTATANQSSTNSSAGRDADAGSRMRRVDDELMTA